jgi:hypothetical protein
MAAATVLALSQTAERGRQTILLRSPNCRYSFRFSHGPQHSGSESAEFTRNIVITPVSPLRQNMQAQVPVVRVCVPRDQGAAVHREPTDLRL